ASVAAASASTCRRAMTQPSRLSCRTMYLDPPPAPKCGVRCSGRRGAPTCGWHGACDNTGLSVMTGMAARKGDRLMKPPLKFLLTACALAVTSGAHAGTERIVCETGPGASGAPDCGLLRSDASPPAGGTPPAPAGPEVTTYY